MSPHDIQPKRKVKVLAYLVDGSLMELTGEHWLLKYAALVAQGLTGRALIHALLTDDWGPLPLFVQILENDEEVARIPYR
jgi:hypothetical protein